MDVLWQCNSNLRDRHRTCGTNTFRRRFYPMQLTARTVSLEEQPVLILCQTWLPGQCVSKFDSVCTLLASLLEAPLQCSSVKGELNPTQEVLWVLSKLHRKGLAAREMGNCTQIVAKSNLFCSFVMCTYIN